MLGIKTYSESPIATIGDIADLVGAFPKFTGNAELDAFAGNLQSLGIDIIANAKLQSEGNINIGAIVNLKAVADLDVQAGEIQLGIANFNGVATLYAKGSEIGEGWVRVVPDEEEWDKELSTDWNKRG
jgi:hypothetical protein